MYTTAQLKAIRQDNLAKSMRDDAVDLAPSEADLAALDQVDCHIDHEPSNSGDEQSSSESEEEMEVEEGELEADNSSPLRRKITYDREAKRFTATQLSPGSLEGGRDTRDLAKLQEILDSNPGAIETLDSMLKAIKSNADVPSTSSTDRPAVAVNDQPAPQRDVRPSKDGNLDRLINQTSETTIYTNAVPSASPSQECPVGILPRTDGLPLISNDSEVVFAERAQPPHGLTQQTEEQLAQLREDRAAAKARTDQVILDAQRQRAELARPSAGMPLVNDNAVVPVHSCDLTAAAERVLLLSQPGSHDLACDDKLYQLTAHIDNATLVQIRNGEYVEFSKLLPREKITPAQDQGKFQIVDEEGKPAFAPYVPKDLYAINCFKKWELAFDIFAKIYAEFYPLRAPELLEYKHIIRRGADSFPWQHVYNYDQIFRQHAERNPGRTWAKKHLETWTNHVTDPSLENLSFLRLTPRDQNLLVDFLTKMVTANGVGLVIMITNVPFVVCTGMESITVTSCNEKMHLPPQQLHHQLHHHPPQLQLLIKCIVHFFRDVIHQPGFGLSYPA